MCALLEALEKTSWIVAGQTGAAALAGMTLQSRMQKVGIRISRSGA